MHFHGYSENIKTPTLQFLVTCSSSFRVLLLSLFNIFLIQYPFCSSGGLIDTEPVRVSQRVVHPFGAAVGNADCSNRSIAIYSFEASLALGALQQAM
uniref:Uncharacterized protein n=1 Tax=Heterorhabditis bacteriophora TaxID=37862 RepID=A0A1I7X7N0_HETBA